MELPKRWLDVYRWARVKPSAFEGVEDDQDMIQKWNDDPSKSFIKKCLLKLLPGRDMNTIVKNQPLFTFNRDSYSGCRYKTDNNRGSRIQKILILSFLTTYR